MFLDLVRQFWQLEQQQWLSPARLSELQYQRLQKLIAHAWERVPYYRRLFAEHGLRPQDIATVDDLRKLPILAKQTLQRGAPSDFLAEGLDPKQLITKKTSGSTGKPLTLHRTRHEDLCGGLTWFRARTANGVLPWHKQAAIVDSDRIPKAQGLCDRVRTLLKRSRLYITSGRPVHEQIDALRSYRPRVISGYSQSLKLLAHALKQSGIKETSPRLVVGSAELLDESARALINEVFGVKMVDIYATVEADVIAWECAEHFGYHLNVDSLVVEFIRNGSACAAGAPGHVVVTPLYLNAMPLIRYDLGDIASPMDGLCPCGRGLPLMQMAQGRSDNFVTLPSGAIIPPVGTFATIIEKEEAVIEYLVAQEAPDLVVVKLMTRGGRHPEVAERVRCGVGELLRHEAVVRVEVVDRIERGSQAKIRRIISKVPVNF